METQAQQDTAQTTAVSERMLVTVRVKSCGQSLHTLSSATLVQWRAESGQHNTHTMTQCPLSHPPDTAPGTSPGSTEHVKSMDEMPGPRGLPLIGNTLKYSILGPYKFEKILHNRLTYMRKYGTIYREQLGPMTMVHLFEPADIATMFRQEGQYPSRGRIAHIELAYLKRNNKLIGFAFRDGPEWARQRGYIQKLMMHPTAASRYLAWQVPVARDFAQYLDTRRDEHGLVDNVYPHLFKYTMESIGAVCFGRRLGVFDDVAAPDSDAALLSHAITETLICFRNSMFSFPWYEYFPTPTYRRFERASNLMRQIMAKHVDRVAKKVRHRPSRCSAGPEWSEGEDVSTLSSVFEMLAGDGRVSPELAVNLIMALFRTGIDSTGNSLAFFLYNLAKNPDKQQLAYQELVRVLPGDASPTPETFRHLPYLKACLRESFRLHFPVFGGSGRVMPADTVFSGYKVPKGVFIFANLAAMSRMEEYFPRPLEYRPERWLRDDRGALLNAPDTPEPGFLSLPFSHGLRACPGKRYAEQSLYLAAIAILQRFRLEYADEAEMGMIHMPFTTPDRPLNIRLIPRQL